MALAVFVFLAAAAPAEAEPVYPELPNFHRVDEHLWRGGQPGPGGMARLKSLGVRTVVNLRYEHGLIDAERDQAHAADLDYVSIPMYGLIRPKKEQIDRILALIDDPRHAPVFVHCAAGRDRTGVVVACYRVARAKWSAEQAIREALSYGMLKVEWAKRAFVREYDAALRQSAAAAVP